MRAFAFLFCLITGAIAAAPLRVKVSGSSHLYASEKDLANLEGRVDAFMHNVAAAMGRSSFLQGGSGKGGMSMPGSMVKHALFLTQPMRHDSPAKVNVIEQKPDFSGSATATADASAAAFDMEKFAYGLATLK